LTIRPRTATEKVLAFHRLKEFPMTTTVARITKPRPTPGAAPSHSPPDMRYVPGLSLVRFLGYFSIGLGMAEVCAPGAMARLTGVGQKNLLPAYGVREIAAGLGILSNARPTGWLWARVAGDVLDLATLGANMATGDDDSRRKAFVSLLAVAGVTALDVLCATQLAAVDAVTND
jgi:hypothetical protein